MIHVCFALYDPSGHYSKFTGTAMLSLFENTNVEVTVHILHDNTLTTDNRNKFIQIADHYESPLKFYNVEELCADRLAEIEKYFPNAKESHFSIAMFYRFFIPHLLLSQGIEKAFYLDSDIIVNLDIAEFWNIELGDKPFGAVSRSSQTKDKETDDTNKIITLVREGLVDTEDYFYSGGLLMNLKVLRNEEAKILAGVKFISEHSDYRFLDQDVLNYAFSTSYLKLPVNFNRVMSFERSENEWAIEKKIYHYAANKITLGMDMNDPYNRLWMNYFIKTPWVDADTVATLSGANLPLRKNYAVSVVIPMYNAEEFIGECLESLLSQTFRDFEVIVVDDCSVDNSVEIVEEYAPKFNGRLRVEKTEKNSGGGGYVPRNIGIMLARGKYIQFLDADDMLLPIALEVLYMAAILYEAEIVYTSSYYRLNAPNDAYLYRDGKTKKWPTIQTEFIIDDPNKNLDRLFLGSSEGDFHNCWTKFVQRDFLLKNKIFFSHVPNAGDLIWVINFYCHAKRFLRISTPIYFYRRYNDSSILRTVRPPLQQCSYWFSSFVEFAKRLHELERANEILSGNSLYSLVVLKKHFEWCLNRTDYARKELDDKEIYNGLRSEFSKMSSHSSTILLPFLFSFIDGERKANKYYSEIFNKFKDYFTARIDIKLMSTNGDFQISSASDDKVTIRKPDFLQKDGIGYQIQSYAGNLEFVAKTYVDGKISLNLRGLNIRQPNDNTKRIPYWIDYTKFTVNGKVIFDIITPAWHDKPYRYNMDVKVGDEVKIQVEWLPHIEKKSNEQENELILFDRPITCAISVVISLYNYEKFIGECLDSILAQTFQDFEVIVVDDCSTDNSFKIIESYVPKFNGRLQITQTKTNSGGGGMPRNKGLELANGEYIFFMDADDAFTKTALEEMYTLAKNYDADVVYCEKYFMSEGVTQEFKDKIRLANSRIQKPPFIDKPTFETNDLAKRTKDAIELHYWPTPWLRLVQRKLLIENRILFDSLIGSNDVGWTFKVLFCSKRFLRIPNICYIRRMHNESTSLRKRTDAGFIHKWMDRSIRSLKQLDKFMSGIKFFKTNPKYIYDVIEFFIKADFRMATQYSYALSSYEIYNVFREKFGDYLGENDVLVSGLCAYAFNQNKMLATKNDPLIYKLNSYITARLDLKFTSKDKGNFQILSISDNETTVKKPAWLQKGGVGYQLQSYVGELSFVAKATVNGQINFNLRGVDVRDSEDKSKRVPYWIDYTKLTVNDKIIFDKITPAWHDEPYIYNINVKADEEIVVEVEWLPHRSDTVAIPAPAPEQIAEIKKLNAEIESLSTKATKLQDDNAELVQTVESLSTKTTELQKDNTNLVQTIENLSEQTTELQRNNDNLAQIIHKFAPYFTARIDIKLTSEDNAGDLQILSMSDDNADVSKPAWFNKNGTGYAISSYIGNLKITAKATADGQIQLYLRSRDTRDPENRSKRIPRWIDYTALTVNEQKILNELTPVWHDKPYRYNMEVKADEEITIEVDWLPHKNDI